MSANLNSIRVSHDHELPYKNLSLNCDFIGPKAELTNLWLKDPNRLICAHLHINSVRNRFHLLGNIIKDEIDILMILETKVDSSFPKEQYQFYD